MRSQRVRLMKRVESSLSEGRKIFRLFRFIDEFAECVGHARSGKRMKSVVKEVVFYMLKVFSFGYYFIDNIVWASSKRMFNKYIAFNVKWKRARDLCSFLRVILSIFTSLSTIVDLLTKEQEILIKMDIYEHLTVTQTHENYILL